MKPKLYLAIDNCFASKRWSKPRDWMRVIKDLGINYVEVSADNECDPLYTTSDYIKDWARDLKRASNETGVNISQFYSGHGTYKTLGLCHYDERIREHILDNWLKPMSRLAGSFSADLGFFCHGIDIASLNSREKYEETIKNLYRSLAEIADYGKEVGCRHVGVETMYSPHQPPWTIDGTYELLKEVNGLSQSPFYITIDVGHQVGQARYLRPSEDEIKEAIDKGSDDIWLGSDRAQDAYYKILEKTLDKDLGIDIIMEDIEAKPHLFSEYKDSSTDEWVENFAAYSPIIHLQQTDGSSSSHHPFNEKYNRDGIIRAENIISSIKKSYERDDKDMPPKVSSIYLTLEIFAATADKPKDIIKNLKDSVDYWRRFIPYDGITLDECSIK